MTDNNEGLLLTWVLKIIGVVFLLLVTNCCAPVYIGSYDEITVIVPIQVIMPVEKIRTNDTGISTR